MIARICLGFLPKGSFPRTTFGLNLWGRFGTRLYNTTQKAENIKDNVIKSSSALDAHPIQTQKIPTYEQIKCDAELQNKLAQMYKDLANDPNFQEVTRYSMKMGIRKLE